MARRPRRTLFPSRLSAGEDLYFLSPLGRPEPPDALLVVGSDGGLEVAWPWAYLCGLPVRRLHPGRARGSADLPHGRTLALVDDGLLAPDAVAGLIRQLRASEPRRLVVVAPALRASVRTACERAGVDTWRTLQDAACGPLDRLTGRPALYPQQPLSPSVAATLLGEVSRARPRLPPSLHLVA